LEKIINPAFLIQVKKSPVMKLIAFIMVALFFEDVPGPVAERWLIQKNSNLRIEGKTNINSFRCEITEYLQADTIYFFREENNTRPIPLRGGLKIEIKRFDCHQKYITTDMRKTLRADEQPILRIDLLNIGHYNGNGDNIRGLVNIWLAGVVKTMEIDYQVQGGDPGYLQLTGTRRLRFSDFGLKPPQKLAGLIKVQEELNVRFQLVLRSLNTDHQIIVHKKE
jgi:hypothetical protein